MAERNQISKIWEDAVRRYEDVIERKLDDPAVRGLTTVDELRDAIEKQNKGFGDFRQKRHGLYAVLSAAMGPIELVGAAAGEAAATVFPASTYVFAAVQYLIEAAKGVSERYDAIVEVLRTLKDFTIRLETYARHSMSSGLKNKMAEILAVVLEILAISQKEMKHGRLFAFGKSLIKGTNEGKEALGKLDKLFDNEKGIVGADTLSEVKGIAVAVDKLNIDVSNLVKYQSAHTPQDQGPLRKIKAILEPSGRPDDKYHAFQRSLVPGTAVWIRDDPTYKAWLRGEESIIWISGNPGAGKSYIATSVVTHLTTTYAKGSGDESSVSVGYFFFKDDDRRTRSFHQGLRDIAYMISHDDQAYARHILATCNSPEDVSTIYKAWKNLFASFFVEDDTSQPLKHRVFIVLDGLDEAFNEDRIEFFELVRDIGLSSRLQLAMFGRLQVMDDIEQYLEMPDVPTIFVTAETNSQDIDRYIRSTISKSVYLKRSPKALLHEIIVEISAKAQGMFVWANFMLETILRMHNVGAIRKALKLAPQGLHEMIRHVLEGFSASLKESPETVKDLNEILMWVTCAARPLRLGEIENILKWKSESGEGMIALERSLRTQLASFFTLIRVDELSTADIQRIQRETALSAGQGGEMRSPSPSEEDWDEAEDEFSSDPGTTQVTFNHASIGDFFRSEEEGPVSGGEGTLSVGVDIKNARIHVLRACLDIICYEPGGIKDSISSELRLYAASAWLEQLQAINMDKTSEEDKEAIARCLISALTKSPGLSDVDGVLQLINRKVIDLIKLWLGQSSSQDIRTWYSQVVAENDADLLDGVVRRIGKRWLATEKPDWLSDARTVADFIAFRSGEASELTLLSDVTILECATWLSLEEDALWHRRLGATLRDLGHYTQAMEQFQKAASLIPEIEQWPIRHSKSWVYVEMRNYDAAVELDTELLQELEALHREEGATEPNKWDFDLHEACRRLAFCYRELKREEEELACLEKASSFDTRCYRCLRSLIRLLWSRQRYNDIATALRRIDKKLPDKDYTGIVEALLTGWWNMDGLEFKYLGVAALYTGNLPWLLDAYEDAIIAARKEHKTVIAVCLELTPAVINDKGLKKREEAANTYKRVLDTYKRADLDFRLTHALAMARHYLGSYLITKAIDVGPLSDVGQECGRQLEGLVEEQLRLIVYEDVPSFSSRERDMDLYERSLIKSTLTFMVDGSCHLFLANYYKVAGRTEDAMSQYAEVVRGCLEILDNDDMADDFAAFEGLFKMTAVLEEPEEAIAIFYMSWANLAEVNPLFAEREEWRTREHEGNRTTWQMLKNRLPGKGATESEKKDEGPEEHPDTPRTLSWEVSVVECDSCWRDLKPGQWEKYCLCYYCSCRFCLDCCTKLRNKTYNGPVCSPLHEWLEVPAPPEELTKNWQVGKMFLRGEWIDIETWKSSLRKRFLEE